MYIGVETLAEGRLDNFTLTVGVESFGLIELRNKQNRVVQISIRSGRVAVSSYLKSNKGEVKYEGKHHEIRVSSEGILFFAGNADEMVRFATYRDGEYGTRYMKVERIKDMTLEESLEFEKQKQKKKRAAKKAA